VIVDHLDLTKSPPRRELFETQWALIDLGRAEWSLAQTELRPEDRELRQRGLAAVEAALQRLTALEKSLAQQVRQNLPDSATRPGSKDSAVEKLSMFERRALWQQIRFRLGFARLIQARLYGDAGADRATALIAADEWLLPLATGPSGERLTSESQLALAEVTRCRGDLDRATKLLATIEPS
jgi:hypothetical protein